MPAETVNYRFKFRRGLQTALDADVPLNGEGTIATDTRRMRVGDGATPGGLALAKSSVGLENVTNDLQLKAADLDTDGTLAANSDTKIPSQKAVRTLVNALLAANDALVFKGAIDCSANPNYPAADAGHVYKISVAGKIGGGSGAVVEANDTVYCVTDGSAAGTHAAVGANWVLVQTNLDGAVIGPASAVDGNLAQFDGATGKLLKSAVSLDTDTTLAADSDTRVPTQKAVKAAIAAAGGGGGGSGGVGGTLFLFSNCK